MFHFYNILLNIILYKIVPKTKKSILKGNKIFGAAIIKKNDYSLLTIGVNNEIDNPLLHGEISTINNFFKLKISKNIKPSECIFLSTHEPCSLCLSAIAWSGFDNFYYFFPYNDTKRSFNIPHDLNILKEIFKINNGKYNLSNSYWKSHSIIRNIKKLKKDDNKKLSIKVLKIKEQYRKLSNFYQKNKKLNTIYLK